MSLVEELRRVAGAQSRQPPTYPNGHINDGTDRYTNGLNNGAMGDRYPNGLSSSTGAMSSGMRDSPRTQATTTSSSLASHSQGSQGSTGPQARADDTPTPQPKVRPTNRHDTKGIHCDINTGSMSLLLSHLPLLPPLTSPPLLSVSQNLLSSSSSPSLHRVRASRLSSSTASLAEELLAELSASPFLPTKTTRTQVGTLGGRANT